MTATPPAPRSPEDPDALSTPPDSDVSERWAESAARVAASAYAAAYGREIVDDATRVRWKLEPRVAATAVVVVLLLGVGAWWVARAEPPLPAHVQSSAATASSDPLAAVGEAMAVPSGEPEQVVVHVSGAVASPGLVTLSAESRIADAIELAGGAESSADLAAVNLARRPHDGEHVHVPEIGEAPPEAGAVGPVDLNSATAEQLETLPGIGPVIAERIVADREAQGPYSSVEDLTRVSGIGDSLVSKLADAAVA